MAGSRPKNIDRFLDNMKCIVIMTRNFSVSTTSTTELPLRPQSYHRDTSYLLNSVAAEGSDCFHFITSFYQRILDK